MTKKVEQQITDAIKTMKPATAVQVIEQVVAQAVTEAKKPRKAVKLPTESPYEFKGGEQVCLFNPKRDQKTRFRTHYEYVKKGELYHTIKDVRNGTEHRVWLNKLMPVSIAKKQMELLAKAEKVAQSA